MKNNIFMKNKKILLVFLPLFLIVYLVYLAVFQLNVLVSLGVRIFTHGTMKIEKVEFKKGSSLKEGRIEILNSKLYDKKLLIADTPKIIIDYKDWKIDRINLYSPKAVFVRKGSDINFVTVFTGKNEDSETEEKGKEKKKENKSVPILKRINVYDADLNYVDMSYSEKISKNLENVNGYVAFENGYKTDLKFTGENGDEKYSYTFSNVEKSYDMRIQLSNINAEDTLVQYGYDSEGDISDVTGVMNLDLRINDDGFFGEGKLSQGRLIYKDLGVPVEDVTLDLQFLGKKIVIDGDYLFFKKKGKFYVEYNDGKGVDVGFKLKNILYSEAANYKILKDSGVQIEDFNIDEVDISLSVKNTFKAQVDFKSSKGFKKEVIALKDISGQLVYENGELKVNNIHTDVMLDREGKTIEREITGNLRYKGDTGRVNLNAKAKEEGFLSDVNLDFLFSAGKEKFKFKVDSDIMNFEGRYEYKKDMLFINQYKNFEFKYNIKDKKIDLLKGYLMSKLDKYSVKTDLKCTDGYHVTVNSKMKDENDEIRGSLEGYANIKEAAYDLKIKAKDINLSDESGYISGSVDGYIKGEGENLEGEFLLDGFGAGITAQKIEVSDILGVVNLKKNGSLSVIFQGEAGKTKIDTIEINGLKISVKYSDSLLEIMNVSNKFLTLSGNYSIINSKIELSAKGRDINKDVIDISGLNYEISEIDGSLSGKINDLNGKFTIKNGSIDLGEERYINFGGDINYLKDKIYAENFKVNENKVNFEYYPEKKEGSYKADIFESMLGEFVPGAKFRIIGVTSGTIKENKINGDFKGSVNEVYYKGSRIPNVLFAGNYDNSIINFKTLDILSNDDKKSVVKTEGLVNIKDKFLSFKIPKQNVPLGEIIKKEGIKGSINLEGKAEGLFEDIEYYVKASEGKVSYNDITVDKIGIDISGNKEKAVLNNFSAGYLNNSLKAQGEYNITENKYRFNVNSSDIDMKLLTLFLEPYGIDKVSGKGKLNLVFTDIVPQGEIVLNNFNISSKKYGIDMNNLNGDMIFDKGILSIKKFAGILNGGSINIKGYLEAEKAINHLLGENFDKIDYNLVLDGRNVNYSFEDYFSLNFNTRLSFRNNAVFGNITVNEGNIQKILNHDFGIVTVVKNFLKDFFNRNKSEKIFMENTRTFSGAERNASDLRINIGFNIDKGIEIDVDRVTSFLTNVKGTILGQGRLTGSLGRLNFLGENSIKDGEFILNGNKFTVDRAIILFNNREEYIPDVNPNITFSTSSIINNKNLEISLDGPVRNMTFTVRSGNEVSVNTLDSVLSGNGGSGEGSNDLSILLTNIIGGQITDIVLNPLVNVLRAVGFSNLRVRSSILAEERKRDMQDESTMAFGAYIEAESPIYKDKLFWKVKANFMNDPANREGAEGNNYNYGVADYDINLYHRLNNNISWGVGVQKLRENLETKKRDMNYYIELKFEKKFDF